MTVEMTVTQKQAVELRDYLGKDFVRKQLEMAVPSWLSPDRLLRVVFTSVLQTPKILRCTRESILKCVIQAAQVGLEPVMGKAALIPYGNECTFQPMFRGLIDLARRSGEITTITAHTVYSNDKFTVAYGTEEAIIHHPELIGDRGEPLGAYTVWMFKDGEKSSLFMPKKDIEAIRNKATAYVYGIKNPKKAGAQDSPWFTHPMEMWKKTVIKRHAKLQPCSIEFMRAVELDNAIETGKEALLDVSEIEIPEMDKASELTEKLRNGKKEVKEPALQFDCPDQIDEDGNPMPVLALQCSTCDKREGCPAHE